MCKWYVDMYSVLVKIFEKKKDDEYIKKIIFILGMMKV